MTLSEFSFRIILLFIPGIISFVISDKLTNHKETPPYKIVIFALIYGFLAYLVYYIVFVIAVNNILPQKHNYKFNFSFISSLLDSNSKLSFLEITIVTALSFPLGYVIAYLVNKNILFKVAYRINVSKKHGDVDVWSYVMNMERQEWFIVRDLQYDLMYEGWIHVFSDSTENDELFIRDVKVFRNSTGEELYETPGMYLPRKRDGLTIEMPGLNFGRYRERERKEEKPDE